MIKEQFRIDNPLDISIPDRKHVLSTKSYESIIGQIKVTLDSGRRVKGLCMAEQTAYAKQMFSSTEARDRDEEQELSCHILD